MTTPAAEVIHQASQSADQIGPTAQEIGEQVRQSIQAARQGALEGAQLARQEQLKVATAQLRAAEAQLRKARTQDQLGAAEQAVNAAAAQVSAASAMPMIAGSIQAPISPRDMIPRQAVDITMAFFVMCVVIVIGWPLARAIGRRVERGGKPATVATAVPEQLQRIEQAVEAMAIEVERISESQRFMAKLQNVPLAERLALPSDERR